MPPVSFEIPRFSGLNLTSDPQEAQAAALDCMNVTLSRDGRLASRPGYTSFVSTWGTSNLIEAMAQIDNTGKIIVAGGVQVKTFDSTGTLIATDAAAPGGVGGFAAAGTTTTPRIYYTDYSPGGHRRYTPSTGVFAAVGAGGFTGAASFAAVTPWDNRVVFATGQAVHFSDAPTVALPAASETFGTNNYVYLGPGDGESIVGMVAWRDRLFVFKQTKFFVIYGTSVSGSGTPVFEYNTVAGIGAVDTGNVSPEAKTLPVAAGRDGVYFLASDGVYVTTGGVPQRISKPLDAWFRNDTLPYLSAIPTNVGFEDGCLGVVADRVYVCPNSTQSLTFVYDIQTGAWTAYNWAMTAICPYAVGNAVPVPLIATASGGVSTGNIFKHTATATTDNGSAISGRYRMGFWNPGQPGTESWVRETLLDGTGSVTVKTAVNDTATLGTGQAATLGTDPAVGQGRDRRGFRGRNVSYEFSGTGQWSLSRVTPIVWGQNRPGFKSA